jgi:hypothetical protein
MTQLFTSLMLLTGLSAAAGPIVVPRSGAPTEQLAAPPKKSKAGPTPQTPALSCTLLTLEAPRGGRLEVQGQGFGPVPLVRIGGKVTRMIERTETRIAVQIPADSNGGPVSVTSGPREAQCGTLTIVGKD